MSVVIVGLWIRGHEEKDCNSPHSRDSSNFSRLKISRSLNGAAESAIGFLQNQSLVKKINIYHFKSTAILTVMTFSKFKLFDMFADSGDIEGNSAFRELIASNPL